MVRREHSSATGARRQTGVTDEEFVRLPEGVVRRAARRRATPCRTGRPSGAAACRSAEQVVLYQELAAHDAPRLVLAFVGSTTPRRRCWWRAPTSSGGAIFPRSSTARSGCRASPSRRPDPIWRACGPPRDGRATTTSSTARSCGPAAACTPTGACCWPAPIPDAPKRKGISYFLMDMTTPGIDVRPIRNAIGDSHFCEVFLNDVVIPAANLVGAENAGWQVAQATLGAERGHDDAGAGRAARQCRLPMAACRRSAAVDGSRSSAGPAGAVRDRDHRPARAVPQAGRDHEGGTAGPADASIVKLYYSELLQRMTDFGAEIGGPGRAHRAGQADVQRLGVGRLDARLHRLVGVDDPRRGQRDPAHDHRRARAGAAAGTECASDGTRIRASSTTSCAPWRAICSPRTAPWTGRCSSTPAGSGWRCPSSSAVPVRRSPRSAVICEEMGRAASATSYLGGAVLAVGALKALQPSETRDRASGRCRRRGAVRLAVALESPEFVPDAEGADRVLAGRRRRRRRRPTLTVTPQPVLDETRRLATVSPTEATAARGAAVRR